MYSLVTVGYSYIVEIFKLALEYFYYSKQNSVIELKFVVLSFLQFFKNVVVVPVTLQLISC